MSEKLSIPDNLKLRYEQVMSVVPDGLCEDEQVQKSILIYLKLGGVKLARQHIKILKAEFCKGIDLVIQQTAGDETEKKSKEGAVADPENKEGTRQESGAIPQKE